MDDKPIFKREDFASQWNVITVTNPLQNTITVHICRARKWPPVFELTCSHTFAQQEFRLEVLYQLNHMVHSIVFTASSVADLYPCRRSAFRLTSIVTTDDTWKFYVGQSAPYNWRDSQYDDSAWKEGREYFAVQENDVLYLRKAVTVVVGAARKQ